MCVELSMDSTSEYVAAQMLPPVVVGARGFLGSAVLATLQALGHSPLSISATDLIDVAAPMGMVFYCSGMAWGAEEHPVEARELHVEIPRRFLELDLATRFVYASSTRVYANGPTTEMNIVDRDEVANSVYSSTKYDGESVVTAASKEHRIVRLSNLAGANTRSQLFVPDIVRQAVTSRKIAIRTSLDSSKDYIAVEDAAMAMVKIAFGSAHQFYNVASGFNIEHRAWIEAIRHEMPHLELEVADGSSTSIATRIDVSRLQHEFPFEPSDVVGDIPRVLRAFRESKKLRSLRPLEGINEA